MTERYDTTLSAVPGEGVLARFGELMLLCSAEPDHAACARQLVELTRHAAAAGHDGRRFGNRIAELLEGSESDAAAPRFVAFGPAGRSAVIVTAGEVAVRIVTTSGEHALTSIGRPNAAITVVSDPVVQLKAGLTAQAATAEPGRWSQLTEGIVAAAGLLYGRTAPEATDTPAATGPIPGLDRLLPTSTDTSALARSPAGPPAEFSAEAASASTHSDNGSTHKHRPPTTVLTQNITAPTDAAPPPTAQVQIPRILDSPPDVIGVYCKNEHFNRPDAPFCGVCGVGMVHRTLIRQTGPRPALGILILDDGARFELDTNYVIGRDPGHDENVVSGQARGLVVTDPEDIVSRIHAQISLDGWDVTIADLGSANGTHIRRPDHADWQQIEPRRPVVITPGTRVWFGSRTLRYESSRTPAAESSTTTSEVRTS